MPFQELPAPTNAAPPTSTSSLLASPKNLLPVFLFPDITGDSLCLIRVAELIQAARPGCKVYIWHNPLPSKTERTTLAYAYQIASEVKELHKAGPLYFLGYSYGANLAALVAHILTVEKRKIALTVIDAPSIEGLKHHYLAHNNTAAISDLVSIFNYAATLALRWVTKPEPQGQKTQKKTLAPQILTEELLQQLSQLAIEKQLAKLKQHFINLASTIGPELHGMMTQYTEVVTQNLLTLLAHENESTYPRLSKILVIESAESKEKYPFSVPNSWEDSSSTAIETVLLASSTHLSIIKDKEKSTMVAQTAANFFHSAFSEEENFAMQMASLVKNHPHVNFRRIFRELEDTQQEEAETKSFDDSKQPMGPNPALMIPNGHTQALLPSMASEAAISQKKSPTIPTSPLFSATAAITPASLSTRSRCSTRIGHRRTSSLTRSSKTHQDDGHQRLNKFSKDANSTEMDYTLSTATPFSDHAVSPASSTDTSTTSSSRNSPASHCSSAEQQNSCPPLNLGANESQSNEQESLEDLDLALGPLFLGPTVPDRKLHNKITTPPSPLARPLIMAPHRDPRAPLAQVPLPSSSSFFGQSVSLFGRNSFNGFNASQNNTTSSARSLFFQNRITRSRERKQERELRAGGPQPTGLSVPTSSGKP